MSNHATKIGMSTATDSFTPRRLSPVSPATTTSSTGSFQAIRSGGRNEKMASQPEATEIEIVST